MQPLAPSSLQPPPPPPAPTPAPVAVAEQPELEFEVWPHSYWSQMKIFDIGANMTHAMFRGKYRGRTKHESDADFVLDRARAYGV